MKQYLALDLGGTYIKYALMGDDGGFLKQGRAKSPMDSMESLMDTIQEIGREFEGQYQGAAVSMPGRMTRRKESLTQGEPSGLSRTRLWGSILRSGFMCR